MEVTGWGWKFISEIHIDVFISSTGSLLNLAKHPASTVQILGAEKALFRALKTKHDTPKYGLIYHASLVGQANTKVKGKVRFSVLFFSKNVKKV